MTKNIKIGIVAIAAIFIFLIGRASNSPAEQKDLLDKTVEASLSTTPTPTPAIASDVYKVVRVIDGDTIEIEGGQTVRYIGMDTPESTNTKECYGDKAAEINKNLVEGKNIKLVKDISETDRYGRLLRYVYLDDKFINDILVKDGYATAATFPPDVQFQEQFTQSEKEAREKKLGLWSECMESKDDASILVPLVVATPTPTSTPVPTVKPTPVPTAKPIATPKPTVKASGGYTCNCSKTCPNMGCAEAQFQLNSCGCSKRDADDDGIACDSQCQ